MRKKEYLAFSEGVVRDIENRSISMDRARETVCATTMEHLEHVPKRIWGDITRIWCWLHLHIFFYLNSVK